MHAISLHLVLHAFEGTLMCWELNFKKRNQTDLETEKNLRCILYVEERDRHSICGKSCELSDLLIAS
jgi:hypothetical protein